MLPSLVSLAMSGMSALKATIPLGLKTLKYFVDNTFRDKVVPVPGSVLYCDLWMAVEHSGIFLGERDISNIVVDGLAESTVCRSPPRSFTSKSVLGRKIYVSCDAQGAVGHRAVANRAAHHVGERAFYGLVIKNCHQFSTRCVSYAGKHEADLSLWERLSSLPIETWEPTLVTLKNTAHAKLGATKWRLWNWDAETEDEPTPEPDWEAHRQYFENQPLNAESIAQIRTELADTVAYETEIADENIPATIRQRLGQFRQTLRDISDKYETVKGFLAACPDARFSHADLKACADDFAAMALQLQSNENIRELARKMGRNYISEEKKKQARIPQASRNEVHGTHRSDDVARILPSELLNLEDETLEVLFYARLLEKNLLCYELRGTTLINGEKNEIFKKHTGPVVACLDTSGSMQGSPLIKAKALLLAIANILKQEDRSLHVLLFGALGEIREFSMEGQNNAVGLLKFLQQGFGGGTDFETPLTRAFRILRTKEDYLKADVLMISDGGCSLSDAFVEKLELEKQALDVSIYSVLCAGFDTGDRFSDEVLVL
jgi:Mg-chelatase subunit ChlD